MFTPKNVSQLLVAKVDVQNAFDAATTAAAKKATLVNVGDYALTKTANEAPASGTYYDNASVGLIVKTATGIKVSEQISLAVLDSYTESTLAVGKKQKITLTYGAVANSTTFVANVILHDGIGGILNERIVNAYVNIDSDGNYVPSSGVKATATLDLVTDELQSQLQASLDRSGEGFTVTETSTTLIVEGGFPPHNLGATDGIANPFEVTGGIKSANIEGQGAFFTSAAVAVLTQAARADDLVQLKNLEWFTSGYDKDPYRDIAWPSSFTTDSNVSAAGIAIGDLVGIYQFHKDRDATNLERQHRQLIVVGTDVSAQGVGTATISGASGSIDSITVGGVEIMSEAENFDTSINVTAAAVAANITAFTSSPNYTAVAVATNVITITAVAEGSGSNGTLVTTGTTLTSVDVDVTSGAGEGFSAINIALNKTSVA